MQSITIQKFEIIYVNEIAIKEASTLAPIPAFPLLLAPGVENLVSNTGNALRLCARYAKQSALSNASVELPLFCHSLTAFLILSTVF